MEPTLAYLSEEDLHKIALRPDRSHKGMFGKLLVVAGGKYMAGAAILCGKAAYRNGVGLVKIYTCECNCSAIHAALPEAIVAAYPENCFEKLHEEDFLNQLNWADAVVIGPGLGQNDISARLVTLVCNHAKCPVLFDADALNLIANNHVLLEIPHSEWVFTPHLGEFSRLTGEEVAVISDHMADMALQYAREHKLVCVLKDANSIIADYAGTEYMNRSGNNGMATAGSGDVLSGIIGAFLAQKMNCTDAAAYGSFIHGLAGDVARKKMGTHAMMASDIIEGLKEVWNKVENK
jgi:NAD(P)H-hydrate epimerase